MRSVQSFTGRALIWSGVCISILRGNLGPPQDTFGHTNKPYTELAVRADPKYLQYVVNQYDL